MYENEASGEGYEFRFTLGENRLEFDKTPNMPWFRCMNKGLDRPVFLKAGRTYRLKLIVDDTIATIYIDGVALNTRMYTKPGDSLGRAKGCNPVVLVVGKQHLQGTGELSFCRVHHVSGSKAYRASARRCNRDYA